MIITAAMLLIGVSVLLGGVYYLVKERNDKESKNIYTITIIAGIILIAIGCIRLFIL